jgi:hypothetical protein
MNRMMARSKSNQYRRRPANARLLQLRADRYLRRINTAIWVLAVACLVMAIVVWTMLLQGEP